MKYLYIIYGKEYKNKHKGTKAQRHKVFIYFFLCAFMSLYLCV